MDDKQLSKSQIFGRKIFFVCATFSLNSNIMSRLMEQEYEVYKIDDFHQVKSLLKLNPDAIVYINADSGNTVNTWFNFLYYFEQEKEFSGVDFGVFSTAMKNADKEKFLKHLKLNAGFFPETKDYNLVMQEVMKKLVVLNAKGRRQFVRIKCSDNETTTSFLIQDDKMFKMKLLDISSIGCGIKFNLKNQYLLKQNSILHGLSLVLGSKQLRVNARIFAIKEEADGNIGVCIFTPDTTNSFRTYVRLFIRDELHKALMNQAIKMPWDRTDYTIKVKPEDIKEANLSEAEQQEAVYKITEANAAETSKVEVQYADDVADSTDENIEELEELVEEI